MTKLKLAICASASFYKDVIEFSYKLEDLGITVILPKTAAKMKSEHRENDEAITNWADSFLLSMSLTFFT